MQITNYNNNDSPKPHPRDAFRPYGTLQASREAAVRINSAHINELPQKQLQFRIQKHSNFSSVHYITFDAIPSDWSVKVIGPPITLADVKCYVIYR